MVGLKKVSDRDDKHHVQVWVDGRMGRESKFYFDSSIDGFALLGDGQDIARIERMQKSESGIMETQEDVLLGLHQVIVTESLQTTLESLCHHIEGKYLLCEERPSLQLMNAKPKPRALATKNLAERSTQSTKTRSTVPWSTVNCHPIRHTIRFD